MSSRWRRWGTPALAFSFGALGVVAASCLRVEIKTEADAAVPDSTVPVDAEPKDQAANNTTVSEVTAPPFVGQVVLFAGNYAPRGWALCDGRELNVSDHPALFSILGTTYGGNGTTFALPDLRGRVPLHAGRGQDLRERRLGERGGAETVTLTTADMPRHTHTLRGSTNSGGLTSPSGNALAAHTGGYADGNAGMNAMSSNSVAEVGGGEPHNNMPPFVVLNYIIALDGNMPSRT